MREHLVTNTKVATPLTIEYLLSRFQDTERSCGLAPTQMSFCNDCTRVQLLPIIRQAAAPIMTHKFTSTEMWYHSLPSSPASVPDYTQVSAVNQEQLTAAERFLSRCTSPVQAWKETASHLLN
jgi:hypothetical protein